VSVEVVRAGAPAGATNRGAGGGRRWPGGASPAPALRWANRLVGNPEDAAGLELTLAGAAFRVRATTVVALTGARAALTVAGRPARYGTAVPVPAGETVEVGPATEGVRSYLAFAGGIAVPPMLGSRSTDTLSGLGPPRLVDGAVLPLGTPAAGAGDPAVTAGAGDPAGPGEAAGPAPAGPGGTGVELRVHPGPRLDWFTAEAVDTLLGTAYRVSPMSNRVGARLTGGAPLVRAHEGELPSEGVVLGAVQVPHDGQPLVFLADHPTTGGYPVVAVVDPADLPRLAQARPGATVRLRVEEGRSTWI
jgi:biotin-dependent carboxylase-like uncharacterized protein